MCVATSCSWVFIWSAACCTRAALASSAACFSFSSRSASSFARFLSCSSSRALRVCCSSSARAQAQTWGPKAALFGVTLCSYLSGLSAFALRSASASRSARPSLALSAPSPSRRAHASSSHSPAALWRNRSERSALDPLSCLPIIQATAGSGSFKYCLVYSFYFN